MRETPPSYVDLIREVVNNEQFYRGIRISVTLFLLLPKLGVDIAIISHLYLYPISVLDGKLESVGTTPEMVIADAIIVSVILLILWIPVSTFRSYNP